MLTVQLPTLLALLGTALVAVVIFAPKAPAVPVTASCAPPSAPPALERWTAPAHIAALLEVGLTAPERGLDSPAPPQWPALVESGAGACDRAVRLALLDALDALRTPWAEAILERALRDDPDDAVQRRAAAALSAFERRLPGWAGVEPGDLAGRQDVSPHQEA
jgi:hypothetical protein